MATAKTGKERQRARPKASRGRIDAMKVDGDTRIVGLRVGAMQQRDQLIPSGQYWVRSRRPWLQHLASMKQREKRPTFGPQSGRAER
jgi:hypothetical protein